MNTRSSCHEVPVAVRERLALTPDDEVVPEERARARVKDAPPGTLAALEAFSTALVNKILHAPTVKLRESSRAGAGGRWAAVVAELFALGEPELARTVRR